MTNDRLKISYDDEYFDVKHLQATLKKRAVKGAGLVVVTRFLMYCIQMIGTVVLARLLTPNDFGLVSMVTSVTMFFMMFRMLGLTDAVVQREKINHNQISTLFWINAAFSLGLTFLLILLSPLISWFYGEPKLTMITIALSFAFVLGGISTQHMALLKRSMQFYKYTAVDIIATVLSVIAAITAGLCGWGYWALITRRLTLALTGSIFAWNFCRWRPGAPARNSGVKPMLKFGLNILGNYTVGYFSRNLDKILIGLRNGTQSLGYYDKAYQLFVLPVNQTSISLTSVAVSSLSRLRDDPEKYRRYYLKAVSLLAFIGMPLSAILTVTGKDVIFIILGPQWGKAGEIFSVFGIGVGVHILYATNGWLHISLDKTDKWFRWGIFGALLTVASFIVGLPFGPIGVAIAYTTVLHILLLPGLWYAGKPIGLKLSDIIANIWRYYFSAFAAAVFSWSFLYSSEIFSSILGGNNSFLRLSLFLIVYIPVYLLLVVIIYQSAQPVIQFFLLLYDMLPNILQRKKSK